MDTARSIALGGVMILTVDSEFLPGTVALDIHRGILDTVTVSALEDMLVWGLLSILTTVVMVDFIIRIMAADMSVQIIMVDASLLAKAVPAPRAILAIKVPEQQTQEQRPEAEHLHRVTHR